MDVFKLGPKDWKILKNLRLEGVKNDSRAFGDSYKESLKWPDKKWKSIVDSPNDYVYVMRDKDEYVGMAAACREKKEISFHIAYIWGIYVRRSYRGKGTGKKILNTLLQDLQSKKGIIKANLNVNTRQIPAVSLYKSLGFKIVGRLHKERKNGDRYEDEYLMEKMI